MVRLKLFFVLLLGVGSAFGGNADGGLYYGKRKSLVPEKVIYAEMDRDRAYVNGFYPFKGSIFSVFSDTLHYCKTNNTFRNDKSLIYFQDNKMFFERVDSLVIFSVQATRLINKTKRLKDYGWMKSAAISPKGILCE